VLRKPKTGTSWNRRVLTPVAEGKPAPALNPGEFMGFRVDLVYNHSEGFFCSLDS
jgi:hypothetical protein